MGISVKQLPDSFRRCMAPETRQREKLSTDQEAQEKYEAGKELELHEEFKTWCLYHRIAYLYSNPRKKATIAAGHPDFTLIWHGRGCCVEFKTETGRLSDDQKERIAELAKSEVPVCIAYNLIEAIVFTRKALNMPPAYGLDTHFQS